MASFTASQLRSVPQDVLLQHIIPLLAETRTPQQEVDRWATEYAEWISTRWQSKVCDLPEHKAEMGLWTCDHVYEDALGVFVVMGATTDMPFSIYHTLVATEMHGEDGRSYAHLIYRRRILQGRVPPPPQEEDGEDME